MIIKAELIPGMLLLSFAVAFKACSAPPPEVTARNYIASAKAFLDSEKQSHPECKVAPGVTPNPGPVCSALARATSAKDLAIDALETYCGGAAFDAGATCQEPVGSTATDLLSKLQSATQNMNQTVSDAKAVISP